MHRAKKRNKILGLLLVLLLLCNVAAMALLFSRLSPYSRRTFSHVVPLTQSDGATVVTTGRSEALTALMTEKKSDSRTVLPAEGEITQEGWLSETKLEIFRIRYEGEKGMTVEGTDGSKVIAPGTSNEFVFTLKNTENNLLDYEMTMEAVVTGTEYSLPVRVRLRDDNGNYLLGDAGHTEGVMKLNTVRTQQKLSAERYAQYFLEWEWPFEQGDDAYDTMLGNLSQKKDISLSIGIKTVSTRSDDDSGEKYGVPNTGESLVLISVLVTMSGGSLLLVFLLARRIKDEGKEP